MRKLIGAAFVSLDGVMQAPGGPEEDPSGGFAFGGWTAPFWTEDADPFMGVFGKTETEPFDLLLGRKTYDIFAGYWPVHQEHPIGPLFNRVTKYVATSSPDSLDWVNSVGLSGDVPARVAELKQGDGPDLLTQGSSVLLHALLAHDLVDELRLMVFPLVLGGGKRWFDGLSQPGGFVLEKSETTSSGVISTLYRRSGEVKTGTVGEG
ncbi:MAG: dihydrofolate reductase [Caulobacteraceae bacterium]|nr:dihydrofolate reductase [Caulobacteraceae bacterium]